MQKSYPQEQIIRKIKIKIKIFFCFDFYWTISHQSITTDAYNNFIN